MIRAGAHPRFIAELSGGYLVLHEFQYFRGHSLFIAKEHYRSHRDMPLLVRADHLSDLIFVQDAVEIACTPNGLDSAELSGPASHVHWHIVPRYGTDAAPEFPAWSIDRSIREAEKWRVEPKAVFATKATLRDALAEAGARIIR